METFTEMFVLKFSLSTHNSEAKYYYRKKKTEKKYSHIFEFDEQSYANDLPLDSFGFQVTTLQIGFHRHGGLRLPTHPLSCSLSPFVFFCIGLHFV